MLSTEDDYNFKVLKYLDVQEVLSILKHMLIWFNQTEYFEYTEVTMADQFCRHHLDEIRHIAESHRTTLFSLYVLNIVFSLMATFGSTLAIQALRKTLLLPTNIRKLLLSLAFSDLAVGLFAHIMLAVVFKVSINYNLEVLCPVTLTFCYVILYLLVCASFLNVTAIAVDRLFAVSLHLRYQELVTPKRVTVALVAVWLTSCTSACVFVTTLTLNLPLVLSSVGFLLTTVAYFRVYEVARYHGNQIHNQTQQQNSQAVVLLRERKSALNVVYIYAVFVACYLPNFCCLVLLKAGNRPDSVLEVYHITIFVILLNSSLNPFIYCWRFPEVRGIMKRMLKKFFRVPGG
ncbi:adrenocorticotropic hormone receptor-like [Montipora capricornis]|uniref:adrenocorticotropic hormone receptor-like n=1 Tax=Montipora capricornis TaxID=246305 RepID=UPI0035F1F4E8